MRSDRPTAGTERAASYALTAVDLPRTLACRRGWTDEAHHARVLEAVLDGWLAGLRARLAARRRAAWFSA